LNRINGKREGNCCGNLPVMVAFFLFVVAQNQAGVFKVQHFE